MSSITKTARVTTAKPSTKQENLHVRATPDEKVLLAEAAERTHQNLSQFILRTALKEAEAILAQENTLRLSLEAYDAFIKRLDEPARDLPALREMFSRPTIFAPPSLASPLTSSTDE